MKCRYARKLTQVWFQVKLQVIATDPKAPPFLQQGCRIYVASLSSNAVPALAETFQSSRKEASWTLRILKSHVLLKAHLLPATEEKMHEREIGLLVAFQVNTTCIKQSRVCLPTYVRISVWFRVWNGFFGPRSCQEKAVPVTHTGQPKNVINAASEVSLYAEFLSFNKAWCKKAHSQCLLAQQQGLEALSLVLEDNLLHVRKV